ncbi:hypothetical protein STEG23_038086, partial [Scotinomys teguina]
FIMWHSPFTQCIIFEKSKTYFSWARDIALWSGFSLYPRLQRPKADQQEPYFDWLLDMHSEDLPAGGIPPFALPSFWKLQVENIQIAINHELQTDLPFLSPVLLGLEQECPLLNSRNILLWVNVLTS